MPKDNLEWITVNGAHIPLEDDKAVGGAGGKFNGKDFSSAKSSAGHSGGGKGRLRSAGLNVEKLPDADVDVAVAALGFAEPGYKSKSTGKKIRTPDISGWGISGGVVNPDNPTERGWVVRFPAVKSEKSNHKFFKSAGELNDYLKDAGLDKYSHEIHYKDKKTGEITKVSVDRDGNRKIVYSDNKNIQRAIAGSATEANAARERMVNRPGDVGKAKAGADSYRERKNDDIAAKFSDAMMGDPDEVSDEVWDFMDLVKSGEAIDWGEDGYARAGKDGWELLDPETGRFEEASKWDVVDRIVGDFHSARIYDKEDAKYFAPRLIGKDK